MDAGRTHFRKLFAATAKAAQRSAAPWQYVDRGNDAPNTNGK
jgi:hypothetical protein